MSKEIYLQDLNESLDLFLKHFPDDREDVDIIVLRGHQLTELLLYRFVKQNVHYPEHIESLFIRWEPLIALVRAMKSERSDDYLWVWPSLVKLERARNQIAHDIEASKLDKKIKDFINCVRSNVSEFNQIKGDDDLKKAIFVVYIGLATTLAIDKWPNITATYLVREIVEEHGQSVMRKGSNNSNDT